MSITNIHPNLNRFSWILGKFKGSGKGIYPTIQPFNYTEEIEFSTNGKPFIFYQQKTWNENGQPLHSESGYLRFPPNNTIEFVCSEPTGIAEVYESGFIEDNFKIILKLKSISRTDTAKAPHTTDVVRSLIFNPDTNTIYSILDMSTETTPILTRHLESHLRKDI